MIRTTDDCVVVLLAGREGDNGVTAGGAQERLVALARVVGAIGLERTGHVGVGLASSVGVELGLEGRREGHFHVGRGHGAQTQEGHQAA